MRLLPIEEAVAAHQNPHLVSVGGAEPAERGSGTAAPLSRSFLTSVLSSHLRQCGATGAIAPTPPCSLLARPLTLTQVTQQPVVASRDEWKNRRTDGRTDASDPLRKSTETIATRRKQTTKTQTLQTWTLPVLPLRHCFPTTANCLTFTLILCLSSLSLALSRSLSPSLSLSR